MNDELKTKRQEIDEIDKAMQNLFIQRFLCVKEIAEYKKQNGFPIFDLKREEELINKLLNGIEDESLKLYYLDFIKEILRLSKAYQEKLNEEK